MYALNPVDEFTEVQESGNHLQSSTSVEVTFGFQHEFFLAWMGTSSWAISGKQKNVFKLENRKMFSVEYIKMFSY